MKRILRITAGGLGTLLITAGTIAGYIAISPWNIGTSPSSGKLAISIFLLCSVFPYMLASGILIPGEAKSPAYESGAPLGSFAVHDENSSNYTRTVVAVAFAVIVMAFCIFFPLISGRFFR